MPTQRNDLGFELLGAVAGLGLGVIAATLSKVDTDEHGRLVTRAGAAFAALWIAVVGGRIAFAYGADHVSRTRSRPSRRRTPSRAATPGSRCSS